MALWCFAASVCNITRYIRVGASKTGCSRIMDDESRCQRGQKKQKNSELFGTLPGRRSGTELGLRDARRPPTPRLTRANGCERGSSGGSTAPINYTHRHCVGTEYRDIVSCICKASRCSGSLLTTSVPRICFASNKLCADVQRL